MFRNHEKLMLNLKNVMSKIEEKIVGFGSFKSLTNVPSRFYESKGSFQLNLFFFLPDYSDSRGPAKD